VEKKQIKIPAVMVKYKSITKRIKIIVHFVALFEARL